MTEHGEAGTRGWRAGVLGGRGGLRLGLGVDEASLANGTLDTPKASGAWTLADIQEATRMLRQPRTDFALELSADPYAFTADLSTH